MALYLNSGFIINRNRVRPWYPPYGNCRYALLPERCATLCLNWIVCTVRPLVSIAKGSGLACL